MTELELELERHRLALPRLLVGRWSTKLLWQRAAWALDDARVQLGSARMNAPRHRAARAACLLGALDALTYAQELRERAKALQGPPCSWCRATGFVGTSGATLNVHRCQECRGSGRERQ